MRKIGLFRLGVAALALAGLVLLLSSLHPRHHPPSDDGTSPKLSGAGEPTIAR